MIYVVTCVESLLTGQCKYHTVKVDNELTFEKDAVDKITALYKSGQIEMPLEETIDEVKIHIDDICCHLMDVNEYPNIVH